MWDGARCDGLTRDIGALSGTGDAEAALLLGRLQLLASQRGAAPQRPQLRAAAETSLRRCKELNPNLTYLADAALRESGEAPARAAANPEIERENPTHGL